VGCRFRERRDVYLEGWQKSPRPFNTTVVTASMKPFRPFLELVSHLSSTLVQHEALTTKSYLGSLGVGQHCKPIHLVDVAAETSEDVWIETAYPLTVIGRSVTAIRRLPHPTWNSMCTAPRNHTSRAASAAENSAETHGHERPATHGLDWATDTGSRVQKACRRFPSGPLSPTRTLSAPKISRPALAARTHEVNREDSKSRVFRGGLC
jgi:hypothetical protein